MEVEGVTPEELKGFLSQCLLPPTPRTERPGCSGVGSGQKQAAWGKSEQLRRVQQGRAGSVRPSREEEAERGMRMRNALLTWGFREASWRSWDFVVTTGTDPTLPGANSI